MNANEVANMVGEYDAGYVSLQDLYTGLLQIADRVQDYDLFLSRIPECHLKGFTRRVEEYSRGGPMVDVGGCNVAGPRLETIAGLQQALGKRPAS